MKTRRPVVFLFVLLVALGIAAIGAKNATAAWYYFEIQGAGQVKDHLDTENPPQANLVDLTSAIDTPQSKIGATQWAYLDPLWKFTLRASVPSGWRLVGWQGITFWGQPPSDRHGAGTVHYLNCDGADANHFLSGANSDICSFTVDCCGTYHGLRIIFEDVADPVTTMNWGPPSLTNSTSATFGFSSNEPGSTFQCNRGAGWFGCTSGQTHTSFGDGEHTFYVRAIDPSGRIDGTPASWTWTVDTIAPDTSVTAGPSGSLASTSASFSFSSSEPNSTFRCSLDGASPVACSSPVSYSGLTQGSHTFEVSAGDLAGNADASPASRTWTVDTVAPETTITSAGSGWVLSTSSTFGFSSSEAASFQCSLDAGLWGSCGSPKAYTGLTKSDHTFRVRARDAAGNVDSSPALRNWTIPVDDRALTASAGWSRRSGTGYYLGTFSRSSTLNAKLTRSSVSAKRLALVATKCPTCGTVKVLWNGALLKKVSLASSVTAKKQIIGVSTFTSLRTGGTVAIKVVSAGKRVEIDGLGVSKR